MSNYRNKVDERYSEMFGALSNVNRLTIFMRLLDCCGPASACSTDRGVGACVGELADGLGLAPSTVSHHLKELRRTELIVMHRKGRNVECSINTDALEDLMALLGTRVKSD